MNKATLEIEDMPFCLGVMDTPYNPVGLPSLYPFRLEVNHDLARLEQIQDKHLETLLDRAYRVGAEMGTPSDNTDHGMPYVEDFLNFIRKYSPLTGKVLEIGAGTGFLSKCLLDSGWDVTSIEPGQGYAHHWDRHGVTVINDFFPSKKITGKFDVIVLYTVLEHIKDTKGFLSSVSEHLKLDGKIFVGVPDCTVELYAGDPSVFIHEHYQYFTANALANTLLNAGFNSTVEKSQYGRSLFAMGSNLDSKNHKATINKSEIEIIQICLKTVASTRKTIHATIKTWLESGSVGIYCPGRILNFLEIDSRVSFYDDAVAIQGKYYPPFNAEILSRKILLANPPNTLLIASRTFGDRLKKDLIEQGLFSKIHTLAELS